MVFEEKKTEDMPIMPPHKDDRGIDDTHESSSIAKLKPSVDSDDHSTKAFKLLEMKDTENKGKIKSAAPVRFAGYTVRTLVLDIPIALVLATYFAILWIHHVHDHYLVPQLEAAFWSDERANQEITYFTRTCTSEDLTTRNGADLFLPKDATPEEAYEHQLLHGFTVFKSALKPETAKNLRNYVLSRNRNLSEQESIFLLENKNRYSFGLGTEEPSVARAVKELATHKQLRGALEKVLGPNPALIEMTAITSTYPAVAQVFHDDVVPTASAINYARTFGPSYSVFVQLQNTTKEMGATGACPGTHYCSPGGIEEMCDEEGFQLVGEDGHWGAGDALLMNMNSYHRGAAHTDPNALDRVMLVLTFTPKPMERAESRLLSQGITFSLRWDMWGHTLNDLAYTDTIMTQPWATLRALGLYKPRRADWGIDYVSSATMRIANEDNGYRLDELEKYLGFGGINWLPRFLHATVDWDEEEGWHEYIQNTMLNCERFMKIASFSAVTVFVFLFAMVSACRKERRVACFLGALSRLAIIFCSLYLLLRAAKRHVDESTWATDILKKRRYTSSLDNEADFGVEEEGPTTFPTRYDVLFENRYGSKQLAMYNDFINGHPGNRLYRKLVGDAAWTYSAYPDLLRDATAQFIIDAVGLEHGRLLHQGPSGDWSVLDEEQALDTTKRELTCTANPLLKKLRQTIRFLSSEYQYGIYRDTALASKHAVPYLRKLQKELLQEVPSQQRTTSLIHPGEEEETTSLFEISGELPEARTFAQHKPRSVTLSVGPEPIEPYRGAWLKSGDIAEGFVDGHWYMGSIERVTAHGKYLIEYPDETSNWVDGGYTIRPFESYKPGEMLEALYADEEDEDEADYEDCRVLDQLEDGTYEVEFSEFEEIVDGLDDTDFRRLPGEMRKSREHKAAY